MSKRKHWLVVADALRGRSCAVGAEIGVFKGRFASKMLARLPKIQKYYCIDPWKHYEDYTKMLRPGTKESRIPPERVFAIFKQATKQWKEKIVVLRMMSMEALAHVPDNSLDWIFIDANHTYEYFKEDLIEWDKKVKVGGLLSGHDFHDLNANDREIPFGVKKAVKELVPKYTVEHITWWSVKESKDWLKV
jgi:hypothetical protein